MHVGRLFVVADSVKEMCCAVEVEVMKSITSGEGTKGGDAIANHHIGIGHEIQVGDEGRRGMEGDLARQSCDAALGTDHTQPAIEGIVDLSPQGFIVIIGGNMQMLDGIIEMLLVVCIEHCSNLFDNSRR